MQHFCNCVIGLAFLYWKEQNVSPQLRIIYSQKLYLLKHTSGVNYYVFHLIFIFCCKSCIYLYTPTDTELRWAMMLSDQVVLHLQNTTKILIGASQKTRPVLKNICQCGKKGKLCFCKVKTIRWSKVAIID